ncbi:MAG: hypothetical protein IJA02_05085 [Clostridia bacterium]|nr:hypothetical protein [Clostridia bacterium]
MKKLFKKSLAVIMVVIMTLTATQLAGLDLLFATDVQAKDVSEYAVGDIIEFGSYPQSEVTDSALLSALNSLSLDWISYSYYSGTGSVSDGQMKPGDFMKYADVTYDGAKYRAVKFTQYRPYYTDYICSAYNSYQDNNGYYTNNVYWFKYEPLQWRVLDPIEGFILCETVIDAQAYSNVIYYNSSESDEDRYCYFNSTTCKNYAGDYETSSIRAWLNDDFYNIAFTFAEKAQIGITMLDNSSFLSPYPLLNSATTYDKIFLLSLNEVLNTSYGFSSSASGSSTRVAKPTSYAKCQGVDIRNNGNSYWWIRTPIYVSKGAGFIFYNGSFGNVANVSNSYFGIRPALKFNPSSEITVKILTPSTTTINYGDTLILHANLGETALPEGYSILWTVEGTGVNIRPSEDGMTCEVTSVQKGDVTVKATVVDENGEAITDADGNEITASQQLKSNVTFWQKIVSFFKNLFRISRIILQSK